MTPEIIMNFLLIPAAFGLSRFVADRVSNYLKKHPNQIEIKTPNGIVKVEVGHKLSKEETNKIVHDLDER